MGEGNDAAETPGPVLEPDGNVGEDCDESQDHGDDGIPLYVVRDGCTHLVGRYDTVRVVEGGTEAVEARILCEEACNSLVEHCLNLVVNLTGFDVVLV